MTRVLVFALFVSAPSWAEEWRGLIVAAERRCSDYDSDDYSYVTKEKGSGAMNRTKSSGSAGM